MNVFEHGVYTEGIERVGDLVLLGTTSLPVYAGFNITIVDAGRKSLNERAVHIGFINGPYRNADYYEETDLRYCMIACLYHVNRLIDFYVSIVKLFEQTAPLASSGNTGDPRIFYEIDAFVGAARRVYETIRKVLWKHYSKDRGGRWRSIQNVLTSSKIVPAPFLDELKWSWDTYGEKLTAYRDCVAHYDPLTDGQTTCWMNRHFGRWGATVRLPANPEERGRRAFDFINGPDALSYCHAVAVHLVDLCESMQSQALIRDFLANPRLPRE